MSAYLIVHANIKDKALYEQFISEVIPIYGLFNAKILAADNDPKPLEGGYKYKRTVIVEFENSDMLSAWYHSIEHQGIQELRHAAADATITYVHGVDHL